ncbi:phage tail protein [Staphylococcus haemolyticus]|uniref:phage tail protein n=1 Tax=Staphylococcus haemolyticus TaxID=1283 RepID=UPI0039BC31BB
MIQYNALEYNGRKTSDFPFKVYVEINDGINIPQRKSKIITTDQMTGGLLKSSDHYSTIDKHYKFYVEGARLQDMAPLFNWLNSRVEETDTFNVTLASEHLNYLKAYDNPGRYYHVLKVVIGHTNIDEFGGYEFDVTFTCNPFSYLNSSTEKQALEVIYPNQRTINNDTSIPLYPQLLIETTDSLIANITIGDHVISIKAPSNFLKIECLPGYQNVSDHEGLQNECMIGDFFKIPPGSHGIQASSNINKITINCRRGELI